MHKEKKTTESFCKEKCSAKKYFKTDEELKKWFKSECTKDYERYYPIKTLKSMGFTRKKCKCGQQFWTVNKNQKICGEPACSGGFRFIGDSPATKKLDYIKVWKEYSRIHKKLGYTPVKRYPVVARWNPTTEFTIASIAAFQPFVVSGEVEPPANPLVIPQFCLRFSDIDNVGITGHFVGFVMLGEHAFVAPKEYDVNKYLKDHMTWLQEGMGIPLEELTVHEDAWAGGGNFGPCVEFFSRGLEVSNQVYMQYENTPEGQDELKIKVLDMGQGHERAAWFTQGLPTAYDATFPTVIEKLKKKTKVKIDAEFMQKFVPLSPYLNVQEAPDIEKAWQDVAKKLGMKVTELKEKVMPIVALYAIAEHSRALLVALTDGVLPSNVGGMYNLRVILRRCFGFIDKQNWDIDVSEVCKWHAEYLKPLFPELSENLEGIKKIIFVEKEKYEATKKKTQEIVKRALEKKIDTDELIELYDSNGISPELIRDEAEKLGKKIKVPDNFYALVAKKHEQAEQATTTEREEKVKIGDIPETQCTYFDDWEKVDFKAKVLKVVGNNVVLDKTCFYPVSGGQLHDTGTIAGANVIDVFKQDTHVIHVLEEKPKFKEGAAVDGKIDLKRRKQLTQHHTATHIVNAAARKVLGKHINQASAKKDVTKAYLDVTHYQGITDEELKKIEKEANKIVQKAIEIKLSFMPRTKAEQKYGMRLYQGGAVPGKFIRVVDIPGVDVEACGGTHLNNTIETEEIKLLKTTKVKDGVVRIIFAAGHAAKKTGQEQEELTAKIAKMLDVKPSQIPTRAQELFEKWKKARKAVSKKKKIDVRELELEWTEEYEGDDILEKAADNIKSQIPHLEKTLTRFKTELEEFKEKLR
ncbi:alanine--tRNA ligase [Candidatus Woesearchaeota archaeon]|nr:alanine--tRNA ligase [Candidatus Woesearchaeota archaeon]MBW3005891.1 alanine--tRNA ligase [Candidatus Woesearchaeota archaeon]